MCKIIAICNQKGGVGKTTTAVSLAAGTKLMGYRTLLVDCDAQCNSTDTLQGESGYGVATIYDLVVERLPAGEAIQHAEGCDVIPGDALLKNVSSVLQCIGKEYRLREALEPLRHHYDYIYLDTPPQEGVMLINALTSADSVIIPLTADRYALQGIDQLLATLKDVQRYTNSGLVIDGLLMNKWINRETLSQEVKDALPEIAKLLKTRVYKTKISQRAALRRSQANRQTIYAYRKGYSDAGRDEAIRAFQSLLKDEILVSTS